MTRQKRRSRALPAINIAPLIDMVFILLIFFLVTTTFVRDRGVEITRPEASVTRVVEPMAMRVSVTASGAIYADGREVDVNQLRDRVAVFGRQSDRPSVVIVPDEQTPSGRLVEVLDTVRAAGVDDVAVATRERRGR
ncbi:ExbD/TolR family protein [Phycisphaerales bacterium AB-hyl4]|uniref:ExbD/TolR family protein n=1 Tax=Natronomicrosphaera hydrolytica TaxID=3242702 RepID=A0ABV4UBN5_9BACT